MRHYSKFKLPRGVIAQVLNALAQLPDSDPVSQVAWRQVLLTDLFEKSVADSLLAQLLDRVSNAVGKSFQPDEFSGVLHYGRAEEVPRHTDGLAKTCFLIPLRCAETLEFTEGYERTLLKGKKLIRFNDHESHGLLNLHMGHFYLLTLSRDRR